MGNRLDRYVSDLAERRTRKKDPAYAAAMDARRREDSFIIASDEHNDLDEFFNLIMRPAELNPWYGRYLKASNKLTEIRRFPKKIKWFIQRGRRGYSDRDLWGFDSYLAGLIASGAEELREVAHGYPIMDGEDFTFEQWQRELSMIADGFRFHTRNEYVPEETWVRFQKYFSSMWD